MKQLVRLPILLQRALSPTELKRRQALHTKSISDSPPFKDLVRSGQYSSGPFRVPWSPMSAEDTSELIARLRTR